MKEHPTFSGYFGSEDGEIYSNKRKKFPFYKLKPQKQNCGYKLYFLIVDGKRIGVTGHRFIAECFIPNPNNYTDVHHLDFDKHNNSVSNLEWVTHQKNCSYNLGSVGKKYIVTNIKTNEVFEILNLTKWCEENNISRSCAYDVIRGSRKRVKNFAIMECEFK